jgi:hypothetical protein
MHADAFKAAPLDMDQLAQYYPNPPGTQIVSTTSVVVITLVDQVLGINSQFLVPYRIQGLCSINTGRTRRWLEP